MKKKTKREGTCQLHAYGQILHAIYTAKKSQSSRLTHGHTKCKNGGAEARGKRDVRQSKTNKQKKKAGSNSSVSFS